MTLFAGIGSTLRALRARAGTVAVIFVVAVIAVAAATAGPTYNAAAQTSILHDTVSSTTVLGRGYEVEETGPVNMSFKPMTSTVASDLGGTARLFSDPVEARQGTAFDDSFQETLGMVWRSSVCAHLVIQGKCPSGAHELMVSRSLAQLNGWKLGGPAAFPSWGSFTITGIYTPPPAPGDYWLDQLSTYFPVEYPADTSDRAPPGSTYDAMFTVSSTLLAAPPTAQGSLIVDGLLKNSDLVTGQVNKLSQVITTLTNDPRLQFLEAVVTSDIPATMAATKAGWSSLDVPVLVVTLELLGLAWLLLFLLVTDASAARGPEIALAKLRGHGRWRTVAFGLSEPVLLLAVALPVGALFGWAATTLLAHSLLRAGTPVGLPAIGWGAAAVATVGGLVAVVAASQRTLRRPIVEQWRHSSRRTGHRGWAIDAVLLTGAVGGLVELEVSGTVSSAHQHPLTLLVPGLFGLAVAVIASRLLPLACSIAAQRSKRVGVAGFLALRQVSRRPGGSRTTIILAASFALATFALSAWSVGRSNYRTVADDDIGAPTVLAVSTPPGADLAAVVAKADPSGRRATPVEESPSGGSVTLAINPTEWNRIANWSGGGLAEPVLSGLHPPAAAPLVVEGDAVRVHLAVRGLGLPGTGLTLNVVTPTDGAPTPVQFAALPTSGMVTATAALPSCPCTLHDFTLAPGPTIGGIAPSLQGTVTLEGIDIHGPSGWQPMNAPLDSQTQWQTENTGSGTSTLVTVAGGLQWGFNIPGVNDTSIVYRDRPFPLPAVAARPLTNRQTGPYTAVGLDGSDLPVNVLATVSAVPGAPANGLVVDLAYADLAAAGDLASVQQQVWLAPGAAGPVIKKLEAQGVVILSTQTEHQAETPLARSGPGLAQSLFVAEAAAAALLAAGGTILSLYLFARRRRYELAALAAVGLSRRTLAAAVVFEQLIVIVFGALVGIGAGLAAAVLVLRDIPEFPSPQPTVPLSTFPSAATLIAALAVIVGATLLAAAASSLSLVRGVSLTQLREAPE